MNLFTLLNANNYHTFNREIARKIGLEAAIMLSEIIDKLCYFEANEKLIDGWFYLTIEDVEQRTTLTRRNQDSAIQVLKKLEFIETKQMGMPAKRHFKVSKEKITEWLNCTNKFGGSDKQGCSGSTNKVGEFVQTTPIYKEPKEEPKEETPTPLKKGDGLSTFGTFVKMSQESYQKLCDDNSKQLIDTVIPEINDYLASTGNKPYKDYPATIRNWIRRRKKQPQAAELINPDQSPRRVNELVV